MMVRESVEPSLETLCRLFGYWRQAYYSRQRRSERVALERELVVQEVVRIRERQKRIGTRKLHFMLGGFCSEHGIEIGRDSFFDLLRVHSLLVRKRRQRKPRTTFSRLVAEAVSQSGKGFYSNGAEPALGERYYIHPYQRRVWLLKPHHGCVFEKDSRVLPEPGSIGGGMC